MAETNDAPNGAERSNGSSPKPTAPQNKAGWDGKLRVNKQATLVNPEALSDPDYSEEDAPPVDQIQADEDLLDDEPPDTEARACATRRNIHIG